MKPRAYEIEQAARALIAALEDAAKRNPKSYYPNKILGWDAMQVLRFALALPPDPKPLPVGSVPSEAMTTTRAQEIEEAAMALLKGSKVYGRTDTAEAPGELLRALGAALHLPNAAAFPSDPHLGDRHPLDGISTQTDADAQHSTTPGELKGMTPEEMFPRSLNRIKSELDDNPQPDTRVGCDRARG